jgi:lipopolysaccharide transport system ATP-binding protein
MSSNAVISVQNLGKCYEIYKNPATRIWQQLVGGRKKFYREFWALSEANFEIKQGETVGIIGRNGSGKSTLLQLICGILAPTTGSVQVDGRVAALLELGAGFNSDFTGRENVILNASIMGLSRKQIDERFDSIVSFADIGDFIEQPVKSYSSGMYVRLAFAIAAHLDADILVIDEALAVGDAFFTQKCMRFLRGFRSHGTILFVSHDTESVLSLCNRAIWLEHGKVLKIGTAKEVAEAYLEAYFEANQGASNIAAGSQRASNTEMQKSPIKDQRLKYINHSNLRNDLHIKNSNHVSICKK